VPDVVDLDEPDLVVVADAPEGADEVAGFNGAPGASGEYVRFPARQSPCRCGSPARSRSAPRPRFSTTSRSARHRSAVAAPRTISTRSGGRGRCRQAGRCSSSSCSPMLTSSSANRIRHAHPGTRLDLAVGLNSARTVRYMRDLRRRLTAFAKEPGVREFQTRAHELLPASDPRPVRNAHTA